MEIIECDNGLYVKGTSKILQAKGKVRESVHADRALPYAQVLSRDGVSYVWLSDMAGEPDDLPEEDQ